MRTDVAQPISARLTESENRNRQKIFIRIKLHVNYNEFKCCIFLLCLFSDYVK